MARAVEKTIETKRIEEVLSFEPLSIQQIINQIGFVNELGRTLKYHPVRDILFTLQALGYAEQNEKTKTWSKGRKAL